MELKEYLKIIKKDFKIFLAVISAVFVVVFSYFLFRPNIYDTSITMNITRIGSQQSLDYQYDNFYRLQADEKFAETIVEWLKSPRIVADTFERSDVKEKGYSQDDFFQSLRGEKRSSQVIFISFSSPTENSAQKLSLSIKNLLSETTENLNKDQKEDTWFGLVGEEPVVAKRRYNYPIIFLAALMGGVFLGFWIVMLRHYLR